MKDGPVPDCEGRSILVDRRYPWALGVIMLSRCIGCYCSEPPSTRHTLLCETAHPKPWRSLFEKSSRHLVIVLSVCYEFRSEALRLPEMI